MARRTISTTSNALALVAGLAVCSGVFAGGTPCNPQIPYTIPDLDQVRSPGMPGGGFQHCVPTCTMNIFKYLTNHGYPSLEPGSGPWVGTPFIFQEMTTAISDLGVYMNTDPEGGTGGTNALAGINDWFEDSGVDGDIVVTMKGTFGSDAPELGDIALSMLANRPISLSVGWYAVDPQIIGQMNRDGGHCVSASRLPDFCTASPKLSIRDPGNGGDAFVQQPGTTETYSIQTQNRTLVDDEGDEYYSGPLERVVGYGSNTRPGYIDGFRSFAPAFGIAACNNPVNGLCVQVFTPNGGFTAAPRQTHFNTPGSNLVDLAIHPSNMHMLVLADPPTGSTGRTLKLLRTVADGASENVALPFSAARVCMGSSWSRYFAISQDGMILVNAGLPRGTRTIAPPVFASQPQPLSAIAFDERNNELVALSASARRLIRFNPDTLVQTSNLPIPSSVVLGSEPRITVCPKGAYIWIASATPTVYGLDRTSAGSLIVAASINVSPTTILRGVDANDSGHVFTSGNGSMMEFAPNTTGGYQRSGDGVFEGWEYPIEVWRIARSHSNLRPAIHDSPEWSKGALPTEFAAGTPDCKADFNFSGSVTVQDLFDFLSAWFDGNIDADVNESLNVSVQDIFDYLALWFAGC